MKKILLLFICICLTVCTITAPVSAKEDNAVPEQVSGLLNAIGVTTPEDNVNPDGVISRGQFAVYAARLAGNRYFARRPNTILFRISAAITEIPQPKPIERATLVPPAFPLPT